MPTPLVTEDDEEYWTYEDGSEIEWGEGFMTYTLADLTYNVARELGIVRAEGLATSGSTTTLADTILLTQEADYWNKGTVWIIRDSAGLGAAPEGEYKQVLDFDATTDKLTFVSALTAAVASGDRYALAEPYVPIGVIESKINAALYNIPPIPEVDITSIAIEDDKTEYALPLAASRDLRRVSIQLNSEDDPNDNLWSEVYNWEVQQSDTGAADTLILPYQYTADLRVRLEYLMQHPELQTYDAKLSESVPVEMVVFPAVLECLRYRKQRRNTGEFDDDIRRWENKAAQAAIMRLRSVPRRAGKIMTPQAAVSASRDDEPGKVYL